MDSRHKYRSSKEKGVSSQSQEEAAKKLVLTPFNEQLSPQRCMAAALDLSDLMTRVATYLICHVIVNMEEALRHDERLRTAHAILQRVTTTHMCNHKLTQEGLVLEYEGQQFQLHEAYKTMALTRTVYEHLAMFYFLYEHPKTDAERRQVWDDWQHDVQRVPYSQAWRYLFRNRDMARMYHHLSLHCHPVCEGLVQYQSQAATDQGADGIPLHLSTCFVACLCQLFLRQLPQGAALIRQKFSPQEQSLFLALSRLPKEG